MGQFQNCLSPSKSSFLSEKEAADYLAVSLSTIRRWRKTGDGPQYYRLANVLRYRQDALEDFIRQNTRPAA
jgi:excisionase family DNA binding protein